MTEMRKHAAGGHEGLEPRGGVAEGGATAHDDVLEPLLLVLLEEGGPLEGAERRADPYRSEVVGRGFGRGGEHQIRRDRAGLEAVGIAGFRAELLCPPRVVR